MFGKVVTTASAAGQIVVRHHSERLRKQTKPRVNKGQLKVQVIVSSYSIREACGDTYREGPGGMQWLNFLLLFNTYC